MIPTEKDVRRTPAGVRFNFIVASHTKSALALERLDPRDRLLMLEGLETCASIPHGVDAIRAIKPMPRIGVEIIHEAHKLIGTQANCGVMHPWPYKPAFELLTSQDVFRKLLAINPSIGTAIVIYQGRALAAAE